jgi:hypothetical protein
LTYSLHQSANSGDFDEVVSGYGGEAEGLKVSLATATSKLAQADATTARRAQHVHLGIAAYRDIAATTLTTEGPREH